MNTRKEFVIWKKENRESNERLYRNYLKEVADDFDFEVEAIETFEEWEKVEWENRKMLRINETGNINGGS